MGTTASELGPLADLLPDALLLVDAGDARVIAANGACRARLGIDGGALVGRSLYELSPAPHDAIAAYLRSCSRTRQPVPGTLPLTGASAIKLRVDGCVFSPREEDRAARVLLRLVPHKESTAQFVALNQKIEALNRELERRIEAERGARSMGERLRVTLSSIGDAVIATDHRGTVTFLNPVAEGLTGWTADEAVGTPLADVFRIVNEQSRQPVESPVDKVLREGVVVGLANHTILLSRDGVERPIDDSGAPIFDADGRLVGVILVFRDFTEHHRLERELHGRIDELAEAHRRKDEFLAMLGHELRNPLAPVRTALELIRIRGGDARVVAQCCGVIERQVEHLIRLVDDLLDVSRITRGLVALRPEPVELSSVVRGAIERTQPLIEQRQHRLVVAVPEGIVLNGDPVRLQQVFANLLHNAAKYTETAGEIRVTGAVSGGVVELSVKDTGIGIPAPLLPHVFDVFVQGAQTPDRSHGGLGIGLSLVKRLVELHGGSVSASSEGTGRGTELLVRLPLAGGGPEASSAKPSVEAEDEAPRRILVVDDNRDAAAMLCEALAVLGHDVATAYDGASALEGARTRRPDVVLLDIGLPGIDGYEVARRMRADPSLTDIGLIAITGYGTAEDVARAKDAGFDAHFTKPVDLRRLRRIVASLRHAPA